VTRRLVDAFASRTLDRPAAPGLDSLTPRERQVLIKVAHGLSNADIARTLAVGEATVKTHLSRVLYKLGLSTRSQAVVVAYESGLVTPGSPHHDPD
jgi:DNA-binding NarL/FixJ family response regulator